MPNLHYKSRRQFHQFVPSPNRAPEFYVRIGHQTSRPPPGVEGSFPRGRSVHYYPISDRIPPPYCVCHAQIFTPGAAAGEVFGPGAVAGQILNQPECCE